MTHYFNLLNIWTFWACPPAPWICTMPREAEDYQMAYDGWAPLDNTAVL